MSTCRDVLKYLYYKKNVLILVLTPLLLSPLLIFHYDSQEARCAYVFIGLIVLWSTQAVPLQVTCLVPLFLFPVLGVLSMEEVCTFYLVEYIILFTALMFISSGVQRYGLHRRIALRGLLIAGSDPKCLLLALMVVTGFLSMWILTLALVSMMMPIVQELVDQLANSLDETLQDQHLQEDGMGKGGLELPQVSLEDLEEGTASVDGNVGNGMSKSTDKLAEKYILEDAKREKYKQNIATCFNLGLGYSGIIGGSGSLVGSISQMLMNSYIEIFYGPEAKISFGNWLLFAAPTQLVSLLIGWVWLAFLYLDLKQAIQKWCRKPRSPGCCCRGNEKKKDAGIVRILREQYEALGPIKWAEKTLLLVFLFLILVWFFEEPRFMPGWSDWFTPGFVKSSTITSGVALICFALPSTRPSFNLKESTPYTGLIDWKSSEAMVPWGILMYTGSFLSAVEATKVSGLADMIGEQFESISSLPYWLVLLVVTVCSAALTEIISGSVIMAITIPILGRTALEQDIHPYYFILCLTLATNFAFCLPPGSVINALIISNGSVTMSQMIKAGVIMNIICLVVTNISINTYGWWFLRLDDIPDWAFAANFTSVN